MAAVKILALGDRDPSHLTHRELDAAFALMPEGVQCAWTASDSAQARELDAADGVWLLPGTPYRDDDAAYTAVDHCRVSGTPFLGTCGGFQYACVGLARAIAGVKGAAHAEQDPDAADLIVVPLQCSLYGERRLVVPVAGTRLAQICGDAPFPGFHWCGYGLDPQAETVLQAAGVVISAHAEDAGAEAIELPDHRFFMATAFQPQVGSGESRALHPLIGAFLAAVRAQSPSVATG
jgi:CTP synthase (UTP-ammonia lyase)